MINIYLKLRLVQTLPVILRVFKAMITLFLKGKMPRIIFFFCLGRNKYISLFQIKLL